MTRRRPATLSIPMSLNPSLAAFFSSTLDSRIHPDSAFLRYSSAFACRTSYAEILFPFRHLELRLVVVPLRQIFGDAVPEFLCGVTLRLSSRVGFESWLEFTPLGPKRQGQWPHDFRSVGGNLARYL